MKLSLREQFEQLAQRPAAPRAVSGSPVTLDLSVPFGHRLPLRITIVKTLSQQGSLSIADAHAILHRLLVDCRAVETLPGVTDLPRLIDDLAKADVAAVVVAPALAE